MTFDFDKVTVGELDTALQSNRFSPEVRALLAKVTGQTTDQIAAMPTNVYKKLVANFIRAAYSPVEADPN